MNKKIKLNHKIHFYLVFISMFPLFFLDPVNIFMNITKWRKTSLEMFWFDPDILP